MVANRTRLRSEMSEGTRKREEETSGARLSSRFVRTTGIRSCFSTCTVQRCAEKLAAEMTIKWQTLSVLAQKICFPHYRMISAANFAAQRATLLLCPSEETSGARLSSRLVRTTGIRSSFSTCIAPRMRPRPLKGRRREKERERDRSRESERERASERERQKARDRGSLGE